MSELIKAQCKFDVHVGVYREFDTEIYLVPPIKELYDIDINIVFPKVSTHNILITMVRELDKDIKKLKKADSKSIFSMLSKNPITQSFSNLTLIDTQLYGITDISDMLHVTEGSLESIKSLHPTKYIDLPILNEFYILDKKNVFFDILLIDEFHSGMLFYRIKNKEIIDLSYVNGVDINYNINDVPYTGHYLGYLFIPDNTIIKLGMWSSNKSKLYIDNTIIKSLNGGEGSNYTDNTIEISLTKGWHKIYCEYIAINSTDKLDLYIHNNDNTTWYKFNDINITTNFYEYKLKIPIYKKRNDIIENLTIEKNQPNTIYEKYTDLLKENDYILYKNFTQNIELLYKIKEIRQIHDTTINVINGSINGTLPLNSICNTNEGTVITENTQLEIINNLTDNIEKLIMLITPVYGQPNIDITNTKLKLQFLNETDNIITNVNKIDIKKSNNVKINTNSTPETTILDIIDNNNFIIIHFNNFYFKKILLTITDNDLGYIKLFTFINSKRPKFKIIGKGNKIVDLQNTDSIEAINYDNINIMAIKELQIPKSLTLLSEYIAINTDKKRYIAKLVNIDVEYAIYQT